MERKKPTLTPEQYRRAIVSLSRRCSSTSVFPGNNYLDIAEWMLQERNSHEAETVTGFSTSKSEHPHDLVVVYHSGERKWDLQRYSQEEYEAFSAAVSSPEDGSNQMVFMQGFMSPSWVSAIGSKYRVDPEFFRQHMEFLSVRVDRHAFNSPSLVSTSNNIFRLCVSTLFHRDNFGEQDVHAQRKTQTLRLGTYKTQQLRSARMAPGDSVVREYSTLCSSFSVLEQWISICITKQDKGWAVIAWMDHGRPLEESPSGSWTDHIKSNATALPVLQNHCNMAFRTTTNRLDLAANSSAEVRQSAAVLPLQYDSLRALVDLARRAPHDPLLMCIPLFAYAACSESQFLDLMESKIQEQINAISEGVPDDILINLQFFSDILIRHIRHLKDGLRALGRIAVLGTHESTVPPISCGEARRRISDLKTARFMTSNGLDGPFTAKGLMEDYRELHIRCVDLSQVCARGVDLAMNKATMDESRKGIEQSERLKKLTVLATLFIPLNFCTSLFGMNIDLLGQSEVSFWWFFVMCIPITLLAYILYLWDWRAARRLWARVCILARSGKLNGTAKTLDDRDASHIV